MIPRGPFQTQPCCDSVKIIMAGLILAFPYSWMPEFLKNHFSNCTVLCLIRMLDSLAAGGREGDGWDLVNSCKSWGPAPGQLCASALESPESSPRLPIHLPWNEIGISPLLKWNEVKCHCCVSAVGTFLVEWASELQGCLGFLCRAISGQWALDPCKGTLGRMFVCLFMLCQWLPFFLCHFSAVRHFLMKAKHCRIQRHSITMQYVRRKRELFQ